MSDGVTRPIEDRDFAEWHGGCRHALVWLIDVDVPAVREAVADARARLDGLLYPRYDRVPHVTVAFSGLAPEPGATPADILYGEAELASDLGRLEALAAEPFTLRIEGWDTSRRRRTCRSSASTICSRSTRRSRRSVPAARTCTCRT